MISICSGVDVLVRGWLHGNCVALSGGPGAGPALIDTGYHSGAGALVDWWQAATGQHIGALSGIGLTHIHSDHAGGVAALRRLAPGAPVWGHTDARALVGRWEPRSLWLGASGQEMPRFSIDRALAHGDEVDLGGRRWRIVWTPGHAVGGVSWWCEPDGLLITGDALWRDGFGLLNAWVDGPEVFALTEVALANLAAIAPRVRVVVPGHGAPFDDVDDALARARSRLAYLRDNPDRHRRQIVYTLGAFFRLTHPALSEPALRAHIENAVRRTPQLEGAPPCSDQALVDEIMTALTQAAQAAQAAQTD